MRLRTLFMASCVVSCTVGDVVEDEDATDTSDLIDTAPHERPFALFPGVNSGYCTASKFNCRFHQSGSRVTDASGNEGWAIQPGGTVIDGNGTALATETSTHMTFNYGQVRTIGGVAYALALTTSNGSAGWYPIDHIVDTTFRSRAGEVAAKDPQQGEMGCYEVVHVSDDTLAAKKVVHDSTEPPTGHERAGDYLPLVRADGKRSVNLLFSVPGFGLGGATTDHFRAGVKFQRVDVPTETNRPSISIPLWVQDAEGRYRTQSGTMRFIYGYVRTANGSRRFGWMARPALQVSTGCT